MSPLSSLWIVFRPESPANRPSASWERLRSLAQRAQSAGERRECVCPVRVAKVGAEAGVEHREKIVRGGPSHFERFPSSAFQVLARDVRGGRKLGRGHRSCVARLTNRLAERQRFLVALLVVSAQVQAQRADAAPEAVRDLEHCRLDSELQPGAVAETVTEYVTSAMRTMIAETFCQPVEAAVRRSQRTAIVVE